MRLRDDVFLEPAPAPAAPRMTEAEKGSLRGIGDRYAREVQDFLVEHGFAVQGPVHTTAQGRFSVGDRVEFVDPAGYRIAGRIESLDNGQALVAVAMDEKALVPLECLEPGSAPTRMAEKRAVIRQAMVSKAGSISETRAPIPINGSGDYAITLQGWSVNKPDREEVEEYVGRRYPGARILDADDSYPGNKIAVVIHMPEFDRVAQGMVPVHSPEQPIEERPEGAGLVREFVDDKPMKAALEQTGKTLECLAALNPSLDVFETAVETALASVTSHFVLQRNGSPLFLKASSAVDCQAELTGVLAEGVAPAAGYIVASNGMIRGAVFGPSGEVELGRVIGLRTREDMFSPGELPSEDARGDWVQTADRTEAPTKQQWDREMARYHEDQDERVRHEERRKRLRKERQETMPAPDAPEHLGGPGLQIAEREAADETTDEYWESYYDTPETKGYGKSLVKDVKATIARAWYEAGQPLTPEAYRKATKILLSFERTAQVTDLASSLIHSRQTDAAAANAIDKMVADYLARNPEELDRLGVYDQALRGAIDYWEMMQPKRLERIRERFAPEQTGIGTAHQPGVGQRALEWLQPHRRVEREIGIGNQVTPEQVEQFNQQPYAQPAQPAAPAPAPAPAAPVPAAEEPGEFNLEFEPEPEAPAAAPAPAAPMPAAPASAAPAPAAPGTPRRPRRPREQFAPTPGMRVIDDRGQPATVEGGQVVSKFPDGVVRFRGPDGKLYTAFPGEAPAAPAPAPAAPAPSPQGGGLRNRLKNVLRGASADDFNGSDSSESAAPRQAYKPLGPQHGAENPTPNSYGEHPTDAYPGRRQPSTREMRFKMTNIRRSGDYVVGDVVWDPEITKSMSAGNTEQNIISFVKGLSTMKDPFDLGNIGRVRVRKLDVHSGVAEVIFRSSEARAFPPEQIVIEEGPVHLEPLA